jgi:hypothetical protein
MRKRNFLLSILVICVGSTVPRTLWAQETLGVSLPLPSYGAFTGTNDNNSVVDTLVTPFAATQSGWITSWEAQFYPGVYNGICYPPLGIQLKVLRPTAPNILTVVSAGNVFDPLALLQARFNTTGCPSFNMDASSVLQFTEPASLQVLAGDVIGLTVTGNSTAPPNTLAYVIPTGASQSNTRVVIQNVPVGGTIDLSNPIVGTLPSLENAVQVQVGDQPSPVLVFTGSNNYVGSDGNTYTSYNLSVSNWQLYDPALFTLTSAYGPCGLNDTPSRTWVDIYDQNSNRIYGFCALNSPYGLTQIWFAEPVGTPPPAGVYVVLTDRSTTPYTTYTSNLLPMSLGATPNGYSPIAEPLVPSGGTNPYQFSSNLFNYKVTYPALLSPPATTVDLMLQPILISQSDLGALVAGTGFQGAQLVVYDGTGGYGVLFRATCQDDTTTVPVPCPQTTAPYTHYTSWNTPSGAPTISNPALLKAPVGTNAWQNDFTAFSQTRIDPTGAGHTCCGFSDFVFVDLGTSVGPAPTISISTPLASVPSVQYTVNQIVYADYSCTGSSVVSCLGTVSSGSAIDTSSVGSKTFEVTAIVSSGLSADQTVTYQVVLATPTVSWATPAAITYGTPLSGAQLNATASVAGTFTYNPPTGTVLGAGSHTLSVTLTPTDTADYSTATASVTLQVNQATPVITWTPASIQLGYSLGAAQLDASASVPGTFAYTPPSGTVITTSSETLSVVFTPTDTTDYTNASMSVSLTVTPGPVASVSPPSIYFGTVYLGTITTKNVTVTNQGDAPMTITDPLLSILSGGNSKEFIAVNLCPKSLAAGKSCKISVSFLAGPFYNTQTATLKVMDNAPGSPQPVTLSATVINPQAHLSATSLSFGTQKVNTSSTAKAVTLKNTGATALTIASIAIAGTDPLDFMQTNNCPGTLAANAGCTVNVTFKPKAGGLRSASVVITDNAQNSPQNISLSGT